MVNQANICAQDVLKAAFDGWEVHCGLYAVNKTYADRANPVIVVEGYGPVGLPLIAQEAKNLVIHCSTVGTPHRTHCPPQAVPVYAESKNV
jgi:hypothetical protein